MKLAVDEAGDVPVLAGVGATRTRDVLRHAEQAQAAGAAGLLLAPVSYQPLSDEEVYGLFEDVDAASSVPVVVYDNPGTTHFTFSDDLHARIADLPHVASIKIPPGERRTGRACRSGSTPSAPRIPGDLTIGISGDYVAAQALNAGCDAWYSVLGGTLPRPCQAIVDAAAAGDAHPTPSCPTSSHPLWDLFSEHGSYRVMSALAEELRAGRAPEPPAPCPRPPPGSSPEPPGGPDHASQHGVPGLDPK